MKYIVGTRIKHLHLFFLIICLVCITISLTGCGQGPVRVVSRLSDDTVLSDVELTDGSFHFTPHGAESCIYDHPENLEHTEWVTYTYADIVDFLQCDLIDVLTKAGVSEWCIPTPEQFFTEGYRMTADEKMRYWFDHVSRETILQAGTIYAGEGFQIAIPYEDYTWQCRKVWLNANLEGQYLNIPVSLEMRESPPNSMVGEIPVYAQYYDIDVPSIGGYAQREFCAWFNVSGYTYCLLTLDCTQEEFLDIVLAIINHYGAYPSQE